MLFSAPAYLKITKKIQKNTVLWCINTHHNGTTVNWLPCAQVSKDNGPAIMVTTMEKIGGA